MRRRAFVVVVFPVVQASASNPCGNGLGGMVPSGQSPLCPHDGDGPNLRPWGSPQPMPGSDSMPSVPVPESTQQEPSQLGQPLSQWWYLDPQTQTVQGPTSARVLASWARSGTLPVSTLVASVDPRPDPGAPASPDNDAPRWQSLAQLVEALDRDDGDGGGGLSIPKPPVWQASGLGQTSDDAPLSEQAPAPPGFEDAPSTTSNADEISESLEIEESPGASDCSQSSNHAQPFDEESGDVGVDVAAAEPTEEFVGYGHPQPEVKAGKEEIKSEFNLDKTESDQGATAKKASAMYINSEVEANPWQLPAEAQDGDAAATAPVEALDSKEQVEQQPSIASMSDLNLAAPLTAADLYASYYRLSGDDDDVAQPTARSVNEGEKDFAAGTELSERPQEFSSVETLPTDGFFGDEYGSREVEERAPAVAVPNEVGNLHDTHIAGTSVEAMEVDTGAQPFESVTVEEEHPAEAPAVAEEEAPSYEAVHVSEMAPLEATAVKDDGMQFDSGTGSDAWSTESKHGAQGDTDDFVPDDSQGIGGGEGFEGGEGDEGSVSLTEASGSATVNATSQPGSATAAADGARESALSMPRAVWSERGSSLEGPHGSFEQRQVVLSLPQSLAMVVTTMKLTAKQNNHAADGSAEDLANEGQERTAAVHSNAAPNLPPGWVMLADSTGRPYYANAATRESSYDPPPISANASPMEAPSNYPLSPQQLPPVQQLYSQAQEQAQAQQQQSFASREGYGYSSNDMYHQRATGQQAFGQMSSNYGATPDPYGSTPYAPYGSNPYGPTPYGLNPQGANSPYGAGAPASTAPYSSFPQGTGAYGGPSPARSFGAGVGPSSGLSLGRMAAGFLGAAGGRKLTFVARSTMSTVGGRTGAVFSMVRGALPLPSKSTPESSSSNAPLDSSASSPPADDDDTDAAPLPDEDDDVDVPLSEGPNQWGEGDTVLQQLPPPPPVSTEAPLLPSRQPLPPLVPPPPLLAQPRPMRQAPSGASSSSTSAVLAAPASLVKWTLGKGVQWALPGLRPLCRLAPHALVPAFKAAPAAVLLLPLLRSLVAVLHTLLPVLTVFAFAGVLPLPVAAAGTDAATMAATAKTTAENVCRWLASASPFLNQPWLLHSGGGDGIGRGSAADAPLALVPLAHVVALPAVVIACVALVAAMANAVANALARHVHMKTEHAVSARLASAREDIDAAKLLHAVGPDGTDSANEDGAADSLMRGLKKRPTQKWANEPSDEALIGDSAAAARVAEAVDALAKGVAAAAAVVAGAGAVAWVARILTVAAVSSGDGVSEGALSNGGEMMREAFNSVGEASMGVGQQLSQAAGCAFESGGHMLKQAPSWGSFWRQGEDALGDLFSNEHEMEEALFGAAGLDEEGGDAVASSVEATGSGGGSCRRLMASMSGGLLGVWPKLLMSAWAVAVGVESLILSSPSSSSKTMSPTKTSPAYAMGSKTSVDSLDENEALEAAATGLVAMKKDKRRPLLEQPLTSVEQHRHFQEPRKGGAAAVIMQAIQSAQHSVGASVALIWHLSLSLLLTAADSTVIAAAVHAVASLCVGYSRTVSTMKGHTSFSGFSMVGLELAQRIGLVGCSALLLRRGHTAVRDAAQASRQLRDLEVPVARVSAASQAAASAAASLGEARRETLLEDTRLISGPNPTDGLRLDNVWVSTPKHSKHGQLVGKEEEEFAVRGLSLHVPGGSVCVVVGPLKSGKSSLLDAIAYAPSTYSKSPSMNQGLPLPNLPGLARGSVQLQGQLRQLWRPGPWRQAVHVMRQQPARFPDLSLAANVNPATAAAASDTASWSSPTKDRRSIEAGVGAALALAGAPHLTTSISSSHGRSSAIGQQTLSSEDWVKIGLARGVRGLVSSSANNGGSAGGGGGAALVLLDEPLGLSNEGDSEEREVDFMSALVSAVEMQPQCAVVIATRSPKLALFATQVVVLGPRGRVLEQGDPEELLAANGHFAELLQASDEVATSPGMHESTACE